MGWGSIGSITSGEGSSGWGSGGIGSRGSGSGFGSSGSGSGSGTCVFLSALEAATIRFALVRRRSRVWRANRGLEAAAVGLLVRFEIAALRDVVLFFGAAEADPPFFARGI